ncbi:MAG TPA: hypothetical protein VK464_14400 [Symbiobacteriaceae bacterium]|nr:hypothetical protein [Symbiobacteriaceae bacterium]
MLDLLVVGEEKEAVNRDGISPELYYRLAVIYRKQNRTTDEIALLKRFAAHHPRPVQRTDQLIARLQILTGSQVAASIQPIPSSSGLQALDQEVVATTPDRVVVAGYVDVETTGLSPYYDEIIELALVLSAFDITTGDVLGVVDSYVGLREPSCPISEGAWAEHGCKSARVLPLRFRGRTSNSGRCSSVPAPCFMDHACIVGRTSKKGSETATASLPARIQRPTSPQPGRTSACPP